MQRISDDLNKMKCLFFVASRLKGVETNTTSGDQLREKTRQWLSPPDPSINHNTACEAHHNGTAAWFLEGGIYDTWKARGSLLWIHGNRTVFHISPSPPLMVSGFVAGSGKSILWCVPQLICVDVAYFGDQFFDHRGHQIHVCNWISFSCLLLL